MWKASFKKDPGGKKAQALSTQIKGLAGYWIDEPLNDKPGLFGDSVEPFFIQYEKRMECLRKKMIQEQKYRLRMYAYATLQFNPIK